MILAKVTLRRGLDSGAGATPAFARAELVPRF